MKNMYLSAELWESKPHSRFQLKLVSEFKTGPGNTNPASGFSVKKNKTIPDQVE